MQADIEIGGTDQKFNLLMGRELQKHFGQKPQTIMTLPLLPGLDGIRKMSKSLDNYIGIDEPPDQIFGKVMSLSDETMWLYFELISFLSIEEIQKLRDQVNEGLNPRDVKFLLGEEIVSRFHGVGSGALARENFVLQFREGKLPDDIKQHKIPISNKPSLPQIMKTTGLVASTSEAIRMLEQGAVKVDGERVVDRNFQLQANKEIILQVGKRRFAKVVLE